MSKPVLVPAGNPPLPEIAFPDLRPALPLYERVGFIKMPDVPCMFDGLPPGVYLLACPCPRHTTYCGL